MADVRAQSTVAATSYGGIDYMWYDFFDVPLGEWWAARADTYGTDIPMTDSYPYLYRHCYNQTLFDTYSSARLNVTGRDMPELNMLERPAFLPFLSGEDGPRGGTAVIDWYMQYVTSAEYYGIWPGIPTPYEGWVVALNGTVTLDRDASMAVLNVTDDGWDDFDDWWTASESSIESQYMGWLTYEAGRYRLDTYNMYGHPLTFLRFELSAQKVADLVVLRYNTYGWGMESLMTRWLRESFMPTEWWFEDFRMHAVVGPETAAMDIDTAVAYAVRAWETKDSGEPCWMWQGMMQDVRTSTAVHPLSLFDLWYPLSQVCHSPGCRYHGEMVPYMQVPGCANLSSGESLTFVRPPGELIFMAHVSENVTDNTTAQARIAYTEPLLEEMPGQVVTDTSGSILTFTGPIDFWTWSRDQSGHENLSDEWDRLGILPWGMPYIEFTMDTENSPPSAALSASHAPDATRATEWLLDAGGSSDEEDAVCQMWYRWDLDGDDDWDTDWGNDHSKKVEFPGLGEYTVSVEVRDNMGESDTASASALITDLTPPVTVATLQGVEGWSSWYLSDVLMDLHATDDGCGVSGTWYRVDSGQWWEFESEAVIGSEGAHAVEYYSSDSECNAEAAKSLDVLIDKSRPAAMMVTNATSYSTDDVTVAWTLSDSVSGVNRSELSLDGEGFVSCGKATERTFLGLEDGSHVVELRVYDNAGNFATDTYEFVVDTPDSSGGSTRGGLDDLLLYAAVLAVGAAAAVAAVLFLKRRKT